MIFLVNIGYGSLSFSLSGIGQGFNVFSVHTDVFVDSKSSVLILKEHWVRGLSWQNFNMYDLL